MNYPAESGVAKVYEQVYPISREQLVDELGDPTIRFVETVREVANPPPGEKAPSTAAWRGLGKLALEMCGKEQAAQAPSDDDPLAVLTEPQRKVAELTIEKGMKAREVADALRISLAAVKKRRQGMYARLGIQSKRELGELMRAGKTSDDYRSIDTLQSLTPLESETLGHIVLGKTNEELARIYRVSVSAIEKRRAKIYACLEVENKYEVVNRGEELKKTVEREIVAMMGTNLREQVVTAIKLCLFADSQQPVHLPTAEEDESGQEITAVMLMIREEALRQWRLAKRAPFSATQEPPIDIPERIVIDDAYGKLSAKEKIILSALSHGTSEEEIREAAGISKRTFGVRLAGLKLALGPQTTAMLRLIAEANRNKIQTLWMQENDEHGLSREENESEWLALAFEGAEYEEIAETLDLGSAAVVKRKVKNVIKKLGVADIFEASLVLAPPTAEMAQRVEEANLSPLEEEIFVKMADNPTNENLATSLQDMHSLGSIRQTILNLKSKLGVQRRLQLARLSYAYRLIEGEQKFQGVRRASTRWNARPAVDSKPSRSLLSDEAGLIIEKKYKPTVAKLVANLMAGDRVERQGEAGLSVPIGMIHILESVGVERTNSALIHEGKATVAGAAFAILADSKLAGPEFSSLQFQAALTDIIEDAIRSYAAESESIDS